MSMFEDNRYRWRETYFVLFDARNRPKLDSVAEAVAALKGRFELTNRGEDERGMFDSLTVLSPDDFAALDICYTGGAEVLEQSEAQVEDLGKLGPECKPPLPWERIKRFDGRFDVLHFERIPEEDEDEAEEEELLDPTALLMVLGALVRLTGGVAVDPQGGTFITEE